MEQLLRLRSPLASRLRHSRKILFLTDYDGTLTPIVSTPKEATLSKKTRSLLRRLNQLSHVQLGVISGRSLSELKEFVGLPRLIYAGNHGLELKGPGLSFVHPKARRFRSTLRPLAQQFSKAFQDISGAWVEWKRFTVTLHWRTVARRSQPKFHKRVRRLMAPYLKQGIFRVTHGKRVVEIRPPVIWDKGKVILWLLRHVPRSRSRSKPLVVYLGDDRTDEDAFQVVNGLGGISVFVGTRARRTKAKYWLKGPHEVRTWLGAFTQTLQPSCCH